MNITGLIKNFPNEIFDSQYVNSNSLLFGLYKEEYTFVKYLRKKMLASEIVGTKDLEDNIMAELNTYDVGELGGKQYLFGEVKNMLGMMLNDFDAKNENNFNGYNELEQYHSIASHIFQMMPNIIMFKMISG